MVSLYIYSKEIEKKSARKFSNRFVDQMPFILEDGKPISYANQWLQALPTHGSKSPNTWLAYARGFIDWYRFLKENGSDPLQASKNDLTLYYQSRRQGEGSWSPSTWNRVVSTLDNFYQWAVEEEIVDKAPFTYRQSRFISPDGQQISVLRNMAKDKTSRAHTNLKWLEEEQLETFLNLGMLGLKNGEEIEGFLATHATRNYLFAELLAKTGLRSQEGTYLTIFELPHLPEQTQRYVRMNLPAAVCKGGKSRWILIPPQLVRDLQSYYQLEHAAMREGGWRPEGALVVEDADSEGALINGKRRKWKTVSIAERKRLILPDGGTPLLFAKHGGSPMMTWTQVFEEANLRCQKEHPNFPHVTPHTLRHTFAVQTLQWLISQVAEGISQKTNDPLLLAGYWRVHDPLLTLRDVLGHSSVSTTQIYLQAIDATRLYANIIEDLEDTDSTELEEAT